MSLGPSHALVDKIFQQLDDGCAVWIPWEQLSSRAKETQSAKKDLTFKLDSSGNLKGVYPVTYGSHRPFNAGRWPMTSPRWLDTEFWKPGPKGFLQPC